MSEGINHDEGKLRVDLVAPEIIEAIARVSGEGRGRDKDGDPNYEDRNWEKGMDWMRQYGSALRHLLKWAKGEDIDPESGCTHLEHALWRLGALVTYEKRGVGTDDRPKRSERQCSYPPKCGQYVEPLRRIWWCGACVPE